VFPRPPSRPLFPITHTAATHARRRFGEEDQLRIMCMAKGFVLNEVFDRLKAALEVLESMEGIVFATSSK